MHLIDPSQPEAAADETIRSARIEHRLAVLRDEHRAGEQQLQALEDRATSLRQTMLRIQGAIAVLEELLAQEQAS